MPLYNEETEEVRVVTTKFDRAYRVTVNYPNKGIPSIRYDLERIERKNGNDRSLGTIGHFEERLVPDNKNTTFNLINEEGEVLGQATYEQVQLFLYSLFFHLAPKEKV